MDTLGVVLNHFSVTIEALNAPVVLEHRSLVSCLL
jgi:hypothetical protein